MRPLVQDLIVQEDATVRAVLEVLSATAAGIVFVVDGNRALSGVVTDGDVRRGLLSGAQMTTPVGSLTNRRFVSLPHDTPHEAVIASLNRKIRLIPLIDSLGHVVDYASFDHLHWMPIMEPALNGRELQYVIECVNSNWISSQGRFILEFEQQFQEFLGGGHALTVMNGTVALHLALVTLGIGPGDEVIVPDLTFAASANAVIHAGASPVLVDVTADTWTIDPEAVEAAITPRTKAIMPVHLYGHAANMDALRALAERHGLALIEDAAEALGGRYRGELLGRQGDAACFSFFGNKMITTGEGGMVVFKRFADWERARCLRDHGMSRERRYWHADVGFNYRMTNLQAAIGLAQLERVHDIIERKIAIAKEYDAVISSLPWLQAPPRAAWADNIHWLYTVLVDPAIGFSRDDLHASLRSNGIETRPVFFPLHEMPPYQAAARNGQFPVSTALSRSGISLPSSSHLDSEDVARVASALERIHLVRSMVQAGTVAC